MDHRKQAKYNKLFPPIPILLLNKTRSGIGRGVFFQQEDREGREDLCFSIIREKHHQPQKAGQIKKPIPSIPILLLNKTRSETGWDVFFNRKIEMDGRICVACFYMVSLSIL